MLFSVFLLSLTKVLSWAAIIWFALLLFVVANNGAAASSISDINLARSCCLALIGVAWLMTLHEMKKK